MYVAPTTLAAGERREYIKALEQRVADLESQLASPTAGRNQSLSESLSGLTQSPDDERNDIFIAVRDLSLSASGHYVGATSSIGISRVLTSMIRSGQNHHVGDTHDENPAPKSAFDQSRKGDQVSPILAQETTERLKKGWFSHIATRYPFLHTPYVLRLFQGQRNLTELYDQCILSLICAASGRWLESAGEMGYFYSEQHYEMALKHMDEILHLKGDKPIDYLLLLALYCTRAPKNPGAWTYVGAAMRICIELGLHRAKPREPTSIKRELEKRKFWTTYSMDRDVCIAIGRPPSISDHDIDTEMPLDLDEAEDDVNKVQYVTARLSQSGTAEYSTLTPFIHRLRLKFIESKIQHVAYRVDKSEPLSGISVDGFLNQLDDWYRRIPLQAKQFEPKLDEPYDGTEFYTIHYHRCVRLLLYPQLSVRPLNLRYLDICARASAGVISDYRQIHRRFAVGFSSMSIQSVFLSGEQKSVPCLSMTDCRAGLTLIYCAWLAPPNVLPELETTLTDCQLLLYIIAERYPSSRKYRDLFERIKSSLMNEITNGRPQPHAQMQLATDIQEHCRDLNDCFPQQAGDEFTQMLYDMMGQLPDPLTGLAMPNGLMDTSSNAWWTT